MAHQFATRSVRSLRKATSTAITTYATGPNGANLHYTAHGVIDQMELGNGLFEQTNFNSLLQVTDIHLGTSSGAQDVWGISNGYASGGSNNGNLLSQSIVATATGMGAVNQTFLYDALDRLTLATENPANTPVCPARRRASTRRTTLRTAGGDTTRWEI